MIKVNVKPYKRKIKGKIYKVKSYKRKNRKKSPKIKRYSRIGYFEIGHDKYGNIKGSRIVRFKKKKKKVSK